MFGFVHSLSAWLILQMNGGAGDKRSSTDLISQPKILICRPVMIQNMHLFVCLCIYLFISPGDLRQLTKMHKS